MSVLYGLKILSSFRKSNAVLYKKYRNITSGECHVHDLDLDLKLVFLTTRLHILIKYFVYDGVFFFCTVSSLKGSYRELLFLPC